MSAHSMPGTMVVACILSWVCVFPDVAVGGSRYLSEASRAMKEEALQYAEDYVTEKIEAALSIPSLPDIQELKDKAAAEVDSAKESALAWQAEVEGKARERFEEAMQRAQDTDLISYPWMCTFEKTLVLNDNLNALAEAAKQAGVNFALISQYSKQAQCGANLLDKMVGKVDSFTESISDLASTVDDAADILKYIPKYGGTIKKVLETVSRIAEKLVKAANKAVQVPVTLLAYVQKGLGAIALSLLKPITEQAGFFERRVSCVYRKNACGGLCCSGTRHHLSDSARVGQRSRCTDAMSRRFGVPRI